MSEAAFRRAYAPERMGREWGFRSSDYAGGRHRGLDMRLVHSSGNYSIETDVIAISDGVVDYIGRPNNSLGPTIRIRRAAGGYEFHSHSIADVGVGTQTRPGTRLGRNARMSERPGLIFGVHDHVVFSDYADGAWNTDRPTHNPADIIARTFRSLAPAPASVPTPPSPPPRRRQKEDPMLVLEISTGSGKHIALLSQGVFSHVVRDDRPDILSDITDSKRTFQIDLPYLGRLLRLWGCDRDIWDIRDGKFVVLDPLGGTVAEGNTWTAERAVRGAIAGIRLPAIDTKPLVAAVAQALADGRDYDAAEIAKAVNDDAARRLQS